MNQSDAVEHRRDSKKLRKWTFMRKLFKEPPVCLNFPHGNILSNSRPLSEP